MMRSRASQKVGMANPKKTKRVVALSNQEWARYAAITPMGMDTARIMIRLMKLSPKVMPMRSLILSHTGRRSEEKERPKSRRDSRDSQSQYCTIKGLSRP